jgi:hypothetical protein
MELDGSLLRSQEPATAPYTDCDVLMRNLKFSAGIFLVSSCKQILFISFCVWVLCLLERLERSLFILCFD